VAALIPYLDRRSLLTRAGLGFGALAASVLFGAPARARSRGALDALHHRPRARQVVFLYMDGGVSQVDSFDEKPRLARDHGQPIAMAVPKTQFDDVGAVLASPWAYRPGGTCGTRISDLFPRLRELADRLCIVRSMTSKFPEHTAANYFLHTGHNPAGRPSMGAWTSYGLGSEADDLPGFVVVEGGLVPPGGLECFGSGFLAPNHQGSLFQADRGVPNAVATGDPQRARRRRALKAELAAERSFEDRAVDAAIANWELAYRMQTAVPELVDLAGESEATLEMYGCNSVNAALAGYGRQCLLARRLVERGVRFVELTCRPLGHDRWDQHSNLKAGHEANARAVDGPIAALLLDLERRGLLETTLVVFAGEFGRTPMAQGGDGRDHNPHGFSIWLAGGGVKGGHVHGATDEFGYFAVEDVMTVHDLHATMLHLLGVDHTRLTFPFGGRDMRLTDVHGEVAHGLIA
jgi:hypothetical protein